MPRLCGIIVEPKGGDIPHVKVTPSLSMPFTLHFQNARFVSSVAAGDQRVPTEAAMNGSTATMPTFSQGM
jgi:hypothetical protein